jgi:hypothetical protein
LVLLVHPMTNVEFGVKEPTQVSGFPVVVRADWGGSVAHGWVGESLVSPFFSSVLCVVVFLMGG